MSLGVKHDMDLQNPDHVGSQGCQILPSKTEARKTAEDVKNEGLR